MYKIQVFFACALLSGCAAGQRVTVRDLSPEGSFTKNCEGPQVDKAGNLFVVNYQKDGTIARFKPGRQVEMFLELPKGSTANSIQLDSKGQMLLADFTGHNVLKVNPVSKEVSVFCHDDRFHQPNDLTISSKDVLYASDPDWAKSGGQIWRISPEGTPLLLETNMGTTNGITLSPDEHTLYVNESIQRNVWAYDVTAEGVSNKRLFYQFADGGLDGMKCDRAGNLYVARWGEGTVAVLSPAGNLLREIKVKGKQVSNLCFSNDYKTMYVTLQDRKCVETVGSFE
jgi:gluconolactonase